jgi:dihydroorotase-like cyclic amidohydrolase
MDDPRMNPGAPKTFQLVVRNARIATGDTLRNIGVRDGVIVALTTSGQDLGPAERIVDAGGRWVIPGAIDTHSHINQRAPEFEHVPGLGPDDNWAAESRSAVAGGCTTALNYLQWGYDNLAEGYREASAAAERQSLMNVFFHGYLMSMDHVEQIPEAMAAGLVNFKMFMPYRGEEARNLGGIASLDHNEMRIAFQRLAKYGAKALVHAEDGDIVDACMHHEESIGLTSLAGWERSRPTIAEGDAAWTAMYLAEKAECEVTIVHVSSLEAIRAREALAYPGVTLESCPHYMMLSTASGIGPLGKVAPPIRDPELARQMTEAVLAGRIDFFGTDHNVWPAAAKQEWVSAKPGLPGIGLMLPLLLTHLVHDNGMPMERFIELTSRRAALRFGLESKGAVALGMDADMVVLDEGERVVRAADLHSAVDYSPYEGAVLKAWAGITICGGTVVYENGVFPAKDFRGEILNRRFLPVAERAGKQSAGAAGAQA